MDVMDAIFQRRAVRHYTPADVPPRVLQELLRAAVQAPSPLNAQPWSFAVFCGRRRLAALSDVGFVLGPDDLVAGADSV